MHRVLYKELLKGLLRGGIFGVFTIAQMGLSRGLESLEFRVLGCSRLYTLALETLSSLASRGLGLEF